MGLGTDRIPIQARMGVEGSPYADTIRGSDRADALHGLDGNDRLIGDGGDDQIYAESRQAAGQAPTPWSPGRDPT